MKSGEEHLQDSMRKFIGFLRSKGLGREEIMYVLVGVFTTIINFGLTAILYSIMGIDGSADSVSSISTTTLFTGMSTIPAPIVFANLVAISASIIFAYFANKLIVFRRRCNTKAEVAIEAVKFIGSRVITMIVEIGIVLLFLSIPGFSALPGKIVSQVVVIILNYILSKLLVFRKVKQH